MKDKVCLSGQEFFVRSKRVNCKHLTSDCWSVQFWGLPYCSGFGDYGQMCDYLASDECGGQGIRKRILAGKYPVNGLPDTGESYEKRE